MPRTDNAGPMQRSAFLATAGAAAIAPGLAPDAALSRIEARTGGRLGVFARDAGSGLTLAHRAGERFPMCSTFKVLAVAAVLARVDRGRERLSRRIAYGESDLLHYSPVARANLRAGAMSLGALCAAALEWSDNAAANLLLAALGGPKAVTRYARSLGDGLTRLDRTEPALNAATPGDPRDTTTPAAMAADWQRLLLGDALRPTTRRFLAVHLDAAKTGLQRIRAGIPHDWRAGDKTGSGDNGTSNDVALLSPPRRAPIVVAAYLTGAAVSGDARDAALAEVGRIVVRAFAR